MKKKLYLAILLLLTGLKTLPQSVAVNSDGSAPNANAMLDIKASNKGLLIPRTSTTSRLLIPNTKGLLVYDTTTNSFWYNNGSAWNNLAAGASGWSLNGNSGTDTSTNFIGTKDAKPLLIKVNNTIAGFVDNSSIGNTGLGYQTFLSNTSGNDNTELGYQALTSNTTGGANTATGSQALFANTTGGDNTANGTVALFSNTTGKSNTATGAGALNSNSTGDGNTASGSFALYANSTGTDNTATGASALGSNTTGYSNTATGVFALSANSTGSENVANGQFSLFSNTIAGGNVANGFQSLYSNTTGDHCVANGYKALYSNTTGYDNVGEGDLSLFRNTTGFFNVANGLGSLETNTTGSNNTAIGTHADVGSGNLINATAIGANATVNTSNTIQLGNAVITDIYTNNNCNIHAGLVTTSDARLKNSILPLTLGLRFINMLQPVTYLYTNQPNNHTHSGFLAQDVEKAATQLGTAFSGVYKPKNDKDFYALSYQDFIMPLVNAVKELSAENEMLKKKLDELSAEVKALNKN